MHGLQEEEETKAKLRGSCCGMSRRFWFLRRKWSDTFFVKILLVPLISSLSALCHVGM